VTAPALVAAFAKAPANFLTTSFSWVR